MKRFTTSDGLSLAYQEQGEGTPILCLAGLTRNSDDFEFVIPHLSNNRLILLDYRGRGQSDYAPDFNTYTVAREAQDALELLDHLNISKTAILGTSRGGLIAMYLAATAKDRLTGVVLNDIGPELMSGGLAKISDYLGRVPKYKSLDEAAQQLPASLPSFTDVTHTQWHAHCQHRWMETEDGLALRYDPKLRDAVLAAGTQPMPDLWPLFDALVGLPLGLIRGANSDLLSPETAAKMRKRRPDMLFANVPKRGHCPFLDEAESLDLLHKFTEQLP